MTTATQATTVQERTQGKAGRVALFGATALTLVALGGAAIMGLRPSGETAVPAPVSTTALGSEGALPKGGLAELYDEQERAATEAATSRGGMSEFYAERDDVTQRAVVAAAVARASERGGLAELYQEQRTAAAAAAAVPVTDQDMAAALGLGGSMSETTPAMGGLAEMYRDHQVGTVLAKAGLAAGHCGLDTLSTTC